MQLTEAAKQVTLERQMSAGHEYLLGIRIKQFSEWIEEKEGRPAQVDDLECSRVNEYLKHHQAADRVRPTTIASYRAYLLLLWSTLADLGHIEHPTYRRIRRPKIARAPVHALDMDQIKAILTEAAKNTDYMRHGVRWCDYWDAIIRVAYDTGLRWGDVVSLEASQVSTTPQQVTLNKTGVLHVIAVHQETEAAVQRIGKDTPLSWPYRRSHFPYSYRQLAKAAGVPGTFKWIRRTSGSYVEKEHPGNGGKHLGHRDPMMFTKHYDDVSITRQTVLLPPAIDAA